MINLIHSKVDGCDCWGLGDNDGHGYADDDFSDGHDDGDAFDIMVAHKCYVHVDLNESAVRKFCEYTQIFYGLLHVQRGCEVN